MSSDTSLHLYSVHSADNRTHVPFDLTCSRAFCSLQQLTSSSSGSNSSLRASPYSASRGIWTSALHEWQPTEHVPATIDSEAKHRRHDRGSAAAHPTEAERGCAGHAKRWKSGEHVELGNTGAQDGGAASGRVSPGARENLWSFGQVRREQGRGEQERDSSQPSIAMCPLGCQRIHCIATEAAA